VVRKTTAKSRFARSLAAVKTWCRTNRRRPAREQRAWLSAALKGHFAYYGIRGTFGGYRSIATKSCGSGTNGWNVEHAEGRSHGTTSTRSSSVTCRQRPRSLTATPDGTNLTREEPDARIAHVRVFGGKGGNRIAYPAYYGPTFTSWLSTRAACGGLRSTPYCRTRRALLGRRCRMRISPFSWRRQLVARPCQRQSQWQPATWSSHLFRLRQKVLSKT
jgi:hypothetical protein